MEPKVAGIAARKQKMQKLLRVPGSLDLQGLNCETLLGKMASGLEKVEAFIDHYAPLTGELKKDNDSDISTASDTSCVRINRSVVSIITRLLFVFMAKIMMILSFPAQLQTFYMDGTRKAKITVKARQIFACVTDKLAPLVAGLRQTALFGKVVQVAVIGSEKMIGKEKTTSILSKMESFIPAAWKAASSTSAAASSPSPKPQVIEEAQPPASSAKQPSPEPTSSMQNPTSSAQAQQLQTEPVSWQPEPVGIKAAVADEQRQQPQTEPVRKRAGGKGKGKGKGY